MKSVIFTGLQIQRLTSQDLPVRQCTGISARFYGRALTTYRRQLVEGLFGALANVAFDVMNQRHQLADGRCLNADLRC